MSNSIFGSLLPTPLLERRGVPFYHDKTEKEFSDDVYERYDIYVNRQTALHLADELYGRYPLQELKDYLFRFLPTSAGLRVADIGCSVGRLIGDIALSRPEWDCYGIDYSYQMLRQAQRYWNAGETITPNLYRYGWGAPALTGSALRNMHFALAKAETLPFPDASLDFLFSTFLIDRLGNPFGALAEWARVLRPGGQLLIVSPLNFLDPTAWRQAHPPIKVLTKLQTLGWELEDWTDPLSLREPMDARGNYVGWQCIAAAFRKPETS